MPRAAREVFLMSLSRQELKTLAWDWRFWGRPSQFAPPGDWSVWLALAGRGFGKTRLGAEWVREQVCGKTPMARGNVGRIALVAETAADARDVMVQGPSGILATTPPDFRPRYVKSDRKLEWPNGAIAHTYSAEDPEQLRGPEHELAWSDELAKWRYAQETWDMLQFGMRIGEPRQLATTTPRPIPLVRQLLADEGKVGGTVVTRGRTFDNTANLASTFIRKMNSKYAGTRLGRQELDAELLEDVLGALWQQRQFYVRDPESNPKAAGCNAKDAARFLNMTSYRRIVVAVDPSGTRGEEDSRDEVGIVVAGEIMTPGMPDTEYVILEDATSEGGPSEWGARAVKAYEDWGADMIVGEENFGGAMVEHTIKTTNRRVPYAPVRASRGKVVRAQPIASLYEQGRVRHAGSFPDLEDQMCGFTYNGYEGDGSPDRADAAVWAITYFIAEDPRARATTGVSRGR
jgi:phage terminase large subunit-like protein